MSQCCGDIIYEGLCKRGRPVKVLDCVVCGFRHLYPKPSEQELADFYLKDYFATVKPDYANTSGTESEYQFLVDQEKIMAASPSFQIRGVALRVLDYGCGPSAPFLKHLALFLGAKNFVGFGYEPSQEIDVRGVTVQGGSALVTNALEKFSNPGDRFDMIHMGFVLEHVANPFKELLRAKKLLAPGGRLIIEVPNDFNPLQIHLWQKLGGVPWFVSSPDHLNMFSFKSLRNLLDRVGLGVCVAGTTYPVELFLAHEANFTTDPGAAKQVVRLRASLQRLWQCWPQGLHREIGRTVWAVARESKT